MLKIKKLKIRYEKDEDLFICSIKLKIDDVVYNITGYLDPDYYLDGLNIITRKSDFKIPKVLIPNLHNIVIRYINLIGDELSLNCDTGKYLYFKSEHYYDTEDDVRPIIKEGD